LRRVALVAVALLVPGGAQAAVIQTKPPIPNATMTIAGVSFHANAVGVFNIPDAVLRLRNGVPANVRVNAAPLAHNGRARFNRWFGTQGGRRPFTAAYITSYYYRLIYLGPGGKRVPAGSVTRVSVKSDIGQTVVLVDRRAAGGIDEINRPHLYRAQTVVSRQGGPVVKNINYRVRQVLVSGTNVITQSKDKFLPAFAARKKNPVSFRYLKLIYFPVSFHVHDAFFGFSLGDGVIIKYPDGKEEMRAFQTPGRLTVPALPRGRYTIRVAAPGFGFTRPLQLTRPQEVDLQVISYVDVAVVALALSTLAIGLIVWPRRHRIKWLRG
jgi:hypothetical protein